MDGAQHADRLLHRPGGENHFQTDLLHPLLDAATPDGGGGALVAQECSRPLDPERAAVIIADDSGSRCGEGIRDPVHMCCGDERHDLLLQPSSASQERRPPDPQRFREGVAGAACGEIHVCVRGVQGDPVAQGESENLSGARPGVDGPERPVEKRVVGDHQVTLSPDRLPDDRLGRIERHQEPPNPAGGIAGLEPGVVPLHRHRFREPLLKYSGDLADGHRHRKKNPATWRDFLLVMEILFPDM